MINGRSVLAVVTARGGSKGLPGKNLMELNGLPLVAWPLKAASESQYVDKIIVSTDAEDIREAALNWGGEAPFLRPAELASDHASSMDVLEHAISYVENNEQLHYDYVVLLEPTSPLTDAADINAALEMLDRSDYAESIVGVNQLEGAHPSFCVQIDSNGLLQSYLGDFSKAGRRQDIDSAYCFDGTLYISRIDAFRRKKSFYHDKTLPYVTPKWKSFEIDDMVDFICVEAIMRNKSRFL